MAFNTQTDPDAETEHVSYFTRLLELPVTCRVHMACAPTHAVSTEEPQRHISETLMQLDALMHGLDRKRTAWVDASNCDPIHSHDCKMLIASPRSPAHKQISAAK